MWPRSQTLLDSRFVTLVSRLQGWNHRLLWKLLWLLFFLLRSLKEAARSSLRSSMQKESEFEAPKHIASHWTMGSGSLGLRHVEVEKCAPKLVAIPLRHPVHARDSCFTSLSLGPPWTLGNLHKTGIPWYQSWLERILLRWEIHGRNGGGTLYNTLQAVYDDMQWVHESLARFDRRKCWTTIKTANSSQRMSSFKQWLFEGNLELLTSINGSTITIKYVGLILSKNMDFFWLVEITPIQAVLLGFLRLFLQLSVSAQDICLLWQTTLDRTALLHSFS